MEEVDQGVGGLSVRREVHLDTALCKAAKHGSCSAGWDLGMEAPRGKAGAAKPYCGLLGPTLIKEALTHNMCVAGARTTAWGSCLGVLSPCLASRTDLQSAWLGKPSLALLSLGDV